MVHFAGDFQISLRGTEHKHYWLSVWSAQPNPLELLESAPSVSAFLDTMDQLQSKLYIASPLPT